MLRKISYSSIFVFLFTLLGATPSLALEPIADCMEGGESSAVTYFLVDRSDELEDLQNLKQSLAVLRKMLKPGERLLVGVSTGAAAQTHVVFDMALPVKSLWVSKLKIRAASRKFDQCFAKMTEAIQVQGESHKRSALLETLHVVSKALGHIKSEKKRVVVYSDMVQNSAEISFFGKQAVDPASAIKRLEKKKLLSSFPSVEFHVAGAGVGISESKSRAIEEFWKTYIERCGGTLAYYGPVLFASS